MKKTVCFLLSLLFLLTLVACKETNNPNDGTTLPSGTETGVTDPLSLLPERDYENYQFTFLNVDSGIFWQKFIINADELTSDIIEGEVYRRNRFIEEKFKIKIKEENSSDPITKARNTIGAGEDVYDVLSVRADLASSLISAKALLEWSEIPYVDLTKDWWCQDIQRDLSIRGKTFFTSGDLSLTSYDCTSLFVFNKQVAEEHQFGNLYQLVREGKWTFDKLSEMMKAVTRDVNNDGFKYQDDYYGIFSYDGLYTELLAASGVRLVSKDENDLPVLTAKTERFEKAFTKILEIINSDNVFFNIDTPQFSEGKGNVKKFVEGEVLFYSDVLFWIFQMTDMEADYGILPNPKFDESQEKYICTINPTTVVLAVPYIASDVERTGIILEALAIHSHFNMIPRYYDEIVTIRNVRDEDSREMITLAFQNRIIDLGSVYNFGGLHNIMKTIMKSNQNILISTVERLENSINRSINDLIDIYDLYE